MIESFDENTSFPEIIDEPPLFDKRIKREYPSKNKTGTEGCKKYHQNLQEEVKNC